MSRFGNRPRGPRFSDTYEVNSIRSALVGQQEETGTTILWFRFDAANSVVDDVYDEGVRRYRPPIELPVLSAIRVPGTENTQPIGFYTTDTVEVRASYEQLRSAGLWELAKRTDLYLRDRFVYDDEVWRPRTITMEEGQVHQRPIAVAIAATEVDPAELTNEPAFAKYAL